MPDRLALLIVEDSAAERALLEAALAEHPAIEWRMAESLSAAQRAIDERPPDVVLLDLELPDARGLEGVAWLQRRNPRVAIVVVSGFGADDLLVACEAVGLGAQDFVGKNRVDGDELARVLQLARTRKRRELEALASALRDPLTDLPGPALLEEHLLRGLVRSRRQGASLALLHLDVDGFAVFAETVGAERAEERLVAIARRLQAALRRTDTIARLDGAAFLVAVDCLKHASDAYVVARKLLAVMRDPFADETATAPLRLSVGIAQWRRADAGDDDGFAAQRARAESAMYEARRRGGDRYAGAAENAIAVA